LFADREHGGTMGLMPGRNVEPRTLVGTARAGRAFLHAALTLVAAAVVGIVAGLVLSWIALVSGVVLAVICWLRLRSATTLELSRSGLAIRRSARTLTVPWDEASEFRTFPNPMGGRMVVFDWEGVWPGHTHGRTWRAGTYWQGADMSLPEDYGMSADELAALLNDYRRRAIR
jgi:hypothetical protein